jgi:hypothetical protein
MTAMESRRIPWIEADISQPGQRDLGDDLNLYARQVRTQAAVRTCAEGDVSFILPIRVIDPRIPEP